VDVAQRPAAPEGNPAVTLSRLLGADTTLTNVFSGWPARGNRNRAIEELGSMSPLAPDFPLAAAAVAPPCAAAEALGLPDFSPLWCARNATGRPEVDAARLTPEPAARL
jgi:nitronate monooxygenase